MNLHLLDHQLGDHVPVLLSCLSHEVHCTIIDLDNVLSVIFANNSLQGADGQPTKHFRNLVMSFIGVDWISLVLADLINPGFVSLLHRDLLQHELTSSLLPVPTQ